MEKALSKAETAGKREGRERSRKVVHIDIFHGAGGENHFVRGGNSQIFRSLHKRMEILFFFSLSKNS